MAVNRFEWLMRRERGGKGAAQVPFPVRIPSPSRQQGRPRRIRRKRRRWHALLVAPGHVDRVERWPAALIAEEHQHAAVRREGRPFIVEAGGEQALARSVRLHDADRELSAALLGEGDE